ncbi:MAG: hypothetical protein BWX88_03611 [Planctomycetes bacterium ADurb.Bin126]|nr:MAG: hypothetical protein BWX88_03611 [Planctomycetes bacterium ADurb.Bin126]
MVSQAAAIWAPSKDKLIITLDVVVEEKSSVSVPWSIHS